MPKLLIIGFVKKLHTIAKLIIKVFKKFHVYFRINNFHLKCQTIKQIVNSNNFNIVFVPKTNQSIIILLQNKPQTFSSITSNKIMHITKEPKNYITSW